MRLARNRRRRRNWPDGKVVLHVMHPCPKPPRREAKGSLQQLRNGGDLGPQVQSLSRQPRHARKAAQGKAQLGQQIGLAIAGDGDMPNVARRSAGDAQALANRQRRESGEVLNPVQPFLGDGGQQLPRLGINQHGRSIGMKGVQSENEHEGTMSGFTK